MFAGSMCYTGVEYRERLRKGCAPFVFVTDFVPNPMRDLIVYTDDSP